MKKTWITDLYNFFEAKNELEEFRFILAAEVMGESGPELLLYVGEKDVDIMLAALLVTCYSKELPMPVNVVGFKHSVDDDPTLTSQFEVMQALEIGQIIYADDLDELEHHKKQMLSGGFHEGFASTLSGKETSAILKEMMVEELDHKTLATIPVPKKMISELLTIEEIEAFLNETGVNHG